MSCLIGRGKELRRGKSTEPCIDYHHNTITGKHYTWSSLGPGILTHKDQDKPVVLYSQPTSTFCNVGLHRCKISLHACVWGEGATLLSTCLYSVYPIGAWLSVIVLTLACVQSATVKHLSSWPTVATSLHCRLCTLAINRCLHFPHLRMPQVRIVTLLRSFPNPLGATLVRIPTSIGEEHHSNSTSGFLQGKPMPNPCMGLQLPGVVQGEGSGDNH